MEKPTDNIQPNDLIVTVKIPQMFYKDHCKRDCGHGTRILQTTKSHFIVEMNQEGCLDLWSDADYYTEVSHGDFGLQSSARATRNAIRKACPNGFTASAKAVK